MLTLLHVTSAPHMHPAELAVVLLVAMAGFLWAFVPRRRA
jgi:hypothetical protein